MASAAFAVDCYWTGGGVTPNWTDTENWENGTVPLTSADNAFFPNVGAPISVTADMSITNRTVYFRNPEGVTMTVASGVNFYFSNSGALTICASEDATIDGPGTLEFSTGGGENWADNQAYPGKILTINAKIIGVNGFEHNGTGGVIVLANPNNDFQGCSLITAGGGISIPSVVQNTGVPSPLGMANIFKFRTAPSFLRYTGGTASTDLIISQEAGANTDATVEHAGTGTLTFTGPFRSGSANSHTFLFDIVDPSAVIDIAGTFHNGTGPALMLRKRGAGILRLSSASTHTGTTTIDQGTLEVADGGSLSTDSLISMRGGTLLFNGGSHTLGTVQVNSGMSTIELFSPYLETSTLTIGSLTNLSGTIDFSASGGLGNDNKIFITGQPDGLIGPWATVKGGAALAEYDSIDGVRAAQLSHQNIATHGPSSVILDNANSMVYISSIGFAGPITLEKDPTEIAMLVQNVNIPAVVAFGGSTLISPRVEMTPYSRDLWFTRLTLGEFPGDGKLLSNSSAGNRLFLVNADAWSVLTVNADITDNGSEPTRIEKIGRGNVLLAGEVSHTGGTAIDAGVLTVANDTDVTWPDGGISGNGSFTKAGDGTLFMPNIANSYAGTTTVSRGTVSILHSQTFGSTAAPTVVEAGGAIDFIGTAAQSLQMSAEEIFAEGAGPDDLGALRNTGPHSQYNAIRFLTLLDELTVYPDTGRLDVRNSGGNSFLNFNGHGIVKKGGNMFGFTNVTATNDQDTAFIDIREGSVTIEENTTFSGGLHNYLRVRNNTYFDIYNIRSPMNWSLVLDNGARVHTRAGYGSAINIWTGPVTLGGAVTFTTEGNDIRSETFTGEISGIGPIIKTSTVDRCVTYLLGTNNMWTGGTQIKNGILYAADKGSLPDYDTDVTVSGRGTLALRVADALGTQPGFAFSEIKAILDSGTTFLSTTASIGLDTAYEDLDYTDPFPHIGIRKFGPNTLTLSGFADLHGPVTVYNGTLDIPAYARYIADNDVYVGFSTSVADPLAVLNLHGDAEITTFDRGYQVANQLAVVIGDTGRGVLRVSDDAKINGRLIVGNANGSVGAVYQTGGIVHNTGGHSSDSYLGQNGYCYYLLADGVFTNNGYTQVGRNPNGYGIIHQTGGTLAFSSVYGGPFSVSRGGQGIIRQEGGVFRHQGTFPLGENSGDNGNNNGYAEFTATANAQAFINGPIDLGNRGGMTAMLNLNGGEVNAIRMWRADRGSQAYVNWNGGLFRPINAETALFNGQAAGLYADVTLYGGGAVIDIPDMGKSKTVDTPLKAPQGFGIISIPVATGGAGYLGSPFVSISGGGGRGASAFAHVDLDNGGVLTHIEITSPGQGYTLPPTVTLIGGGATTAATLGMVAIGPVASGGLLKLGEGRLTLNAVNTYMGPTEVREGMLRLKETDVLSPYTSVAVTGGTLDLGGGTLSNGNVSVTSGSVVNGRIAAGAISKDGPGTFTLSTPLAIGPSSPPPRALTPGLWEGMIRDPFDQHTASPKTGIQLTTRAANGGVQASNATYAGGLWNGNNHTYIYSGYIWNNSDEDVTWTFFGRFDDNMNLVIDGKQLIRTGNGGADQFVTYTLTPGPHPFEARFGDGAGEVGPGPNNRALRPAVGPMSGLLVDYSGAIPVLDGERIDLTTFQILEDPGDGSLFTIDIPDSDPSGPGLSEYVVQQNWNATADGLYMGRQLTTRAGNIPFGVNFADPQAEFWGGNNHTWVYKGILWNRGETSVTWTWRLLFDDDIMLKIDDQLVAEARNNNQTPTYADTILAPGPHEIEIRFGDGSGSVGPHSGLGGLTYDPNGGGASSDLSNFILLEDPGDGSLLTTDLDWTPSEETVESEYPVVNVRDGTLRLRASAAAGLYEGRLGGSFNETDPNPEDCIELTTTAANGACSSNGYINDKHWPDSTTYVYTGYIWNRTGGDATWTFAENFDDNVRLWIDATPYTLNWDNPQQVLRDMGWNVPTCGTITLSPGPHKFEVRFGQGGGGAAANPTSNGWGNDMSFGIDFGGNDQVDRSYFQFLEDPGNGSLLTWTLYDNLGKDELLETAQVNLGDTAVLDLDTTSHKVGVIAGSGTVINGILAGGSVISPAGDDAIGTLAFDGVTFAPGVTYRVTTDGSACDLITVTGTLDLSGLTIVPATEVMPTLPSYVIAHATGGFIGGKPALDGFPSKYRMMTRGNDLLLTSLGGTVLILR